MKRDSVLVFALTFFLYFTALERPAHAETSSEPYIDELREEIRQHKKKSPVDGTPSESEESESYTEKIKRRLEQENPSEVNPNGQGYIDELKSDDPSKFKKPSENSFIEQEKQNIPPASEGGAIQAFQEGKSELKAKKNENIHHAFGIRYGLNMHQNFTVSGDKGANSFSDVYGYSYAPDLSFFYEFQPFHSEWYGHIGLFAMVGGAYYHGLGQFTNAPTVNGNTFDKETDVKFQFFTIPFTIGLDYRFTLFHYLRPYIMIGPSAVIYSERRNDGGDDINGNLKGYFISVGTAVLLDFFHGDSWNNYQNYSVKHLYFTVDFTRQGTLSGDLNMSVNGIVGGFMVEY